MHRPSVRRALSALVCALFAGFGVEARAAAVSVELLSQAPAGTTAVYGTSAPFRRPWSADGRYVAITSVGPDLAPGQRDDNRTSDVFLVDRQTGRVVLVSHTAISPRHTGNRSSSASAISDNGRYVVFSSNATDLASGTMAPSAHAQLFLYDATLDLIRLVSRTHADTGVGGNGISNAVAVHDSGRVLFNSEASDLVADDVGGSGSDVFLFDPASGAMQLVSHPWDQPGRSGGGSSSATTFSADGNFVLLQSSAAALVEGLAPASGADVYLHDLAQDRTILVSRRPDGLRAGSSSPVALTPDGSRVLFASTASDVTAVQDLNLQTDAFVFERATAEVRLVAKSSVAERTPDSASLPIGFSADGQRVLLHSAATDLLPDMERYVGEREAFVIDLRGGLPILVTHSANQPRRGLGGSTPYAISAAGNGVLYGSIKTDAVSGITDTNLTEDIFLYDLASSTATLVTRRAAGSAAAGLSRSATFGASDSKVLYRSDAPDLVSGLVDGNGAPDVFVYDIPAGVSELVLRATGTVRGTPPGPTYTTTTTPNGQAALLWGEGRLDRTLPPGTGTDSYHFDRSSRIVTRLQVPLPTAPHVATSYVRHMTDDGATVLFNSAQRWMVGVPTDENAGADAFLRDIGSAAPPQLLSRAVAGPFTTANRPTFGTAMDRSGRYTLLIGYATDLVAGVTDAPQTADVFLFDRQTSTTTLVTHAPGQPLVAAGGAEHAWISPDGEWILVTCSSPLLGAIQREYPSAKDLYLIERATGQVTLVTHMPGSPLEAAAGRHLVSGMTADARVILFSSDSPGLVAGQVDDNGRADAFVYERDTEATMLISHMPGEPLHAGPGASNLILSGDGSRVSYDRFLQLYPDFGISVQDLVLYDRATASAAVISGPEETGGSGENIIGLGVGLSHDGRRVLFLSNAVNLDPNNVDGNGRTDVFVHDVDLERTTLVSRSALTPGRSGDNSSYATDFTDDGTGILFWSRATDLTENIDLNAAPDAFYATVDYDALHSGGFEGRAPPP